MSYNSRNRVNMTDYVNNLNIVVPPNTQDLQKATDDYNTADEDLAIWSNTQFSEDLGPYTNPDYPFGGDQIITPAELEFKPLDKAFDFDNDYNFNFDFPQTQPSVYTAEAHAHAHPHPIQTNGFHHPPAPSTAASPTNLTSPAVGEKRKTAQAASPTSYEDSARLAAEEDKRRRNTAASARFRVKKKQREAALEKSAKEMADKVSAFEEKITKLELENKWLRDLVTRKADTNLDLTAMWKKHIAEQDGPERKGAERKDGVGTKA
ncbi:hypothetical protein B0O99DRAFT_635755 [Bisporella sp. PMI_857]|nr:hypothetical protein B0O99DRAFT_635755 [Bisporella sp. PMI_857]